MSEWGTVDINANRIKQTYVKGFLDISGGPLIVQRSSSLQIIASDSNNPRVEFKPGAVFTVNTTSNFDVSYTALATLGLLGVSFEQSTADINSRVKYITTSATGSSSSTTITLTGSGLPIAIPVGTDVAYIASNGQTIQTGSFVTTAAAAAATSVTINSAIAVPGSVVAIPSASTIVFTQYPEVLVKFNQALHGYYSATGA